MTTPPRSQWSRTRIWCAEHVYRGNFQSGPCSRKGVVREEGKDWCKQHAPSAVKARHEAHEAECKRSNERRDRRQIAFGLRMASTEQLRAELRRRED